MRYLTAPEVAVETRKHPVTIRKALEGGELHGAQRTKGGRWTVREDCAEAWVEGRQCEHQLAEVPRLADRRRAVAR